MAYRYNLAGKLIVANNTLKPIQCQVELKIEVIDFEKSKDNNNYIGGMKVTGELSYADSNPPKLGLSSGMGANNDLRLTVFDSVNGLPSSIYSEFNIILFERMGSIDRGLDRIYFWQFTNIGPLLADHLGLFPEDYKFSKNKKVFMCRDFRGNWPYPVSALIVADNRYEAKKILKNKLNVLNIPCFNDDSFTLEEIDTTVSDTYLIQDGN